MPKIDKNIYIYILIFLSKNQEDGDRETKGNLTPSLWHTSAENLNPNLDFG